MLFSTFRGKYQRQEDKAMQQDKNVEKACYLTKRREHIRLSMQACEIVIFRNHLDVTKSKFVSVLFAQLKFAEAPVFYSFF